MEGPVALRRGRVAGRFLKLLLPVATIVFAGSATGAPALPTGQYKTEGGWGTLVVNPSSATAGQPVRISARGVNQSSCGLTGIIAQGEAHISSNSNSALVCTVTFQGNGSSIAVKLLGDSPNWEECRVSLCGARTDFEAEYFRLPASCTDAEREKTDAAFAAVFRAGDYQHAYDLLQSVESTCGRFLGWVEKDKTHNNLAVALHRLHRDPECLQELSQTEAASAANEAGLQKRFLGAPFDLALYLPVAQTTWKVEKACSSPQATAG